MNLDKVQKYLLSLPVKDRTGDRMEALLVGMNEDESVVFEQWVKTIELPQPILQPTLLDLEVDDDIAEAALARAGQRQRFKRPLVAMSLADKRREWAEMLAHKPRHAGDLVSPVRIEQLAKAIGAPDEERRQLLRTIGRSEG